MNIKAFYQLVDNNLTKGGSALFDKFKLDNTDLITAVSNSDPGAVAEALNAWVNPNKMDGLERLALPIAIDNNNELIVGMLLARKADPNVRGKEGETALYKAVFWENENIVRLLLDKGAKAKFPNLDGKTPIQAAKENGYKNILALLTNDPIELKRMQLERDQATHKNMKAQAQRAKASKLNKTLPTLEVIAEIPKAKELEVKKGDGIVQKYGIDKSAFTSLIAAIKNQDSQAVKFFAEKVEDFNIYEEGESPLLLAIEGGKEKLAIYLVDHGANLFMKDEANNYPFVNSSVQHQLYELLGIACRKTEAVADKFNDVKQSFSPQFLAYKDPRMMDLLLQNGADPFFGGKDGVSPIIKAIQKGSIAILPVLSKQNISFDQKIEGKTIIQWAVELERLDWLNGLLTENAQANATAEDKAAIKAAADKTSNVDVKRIIALL